MLHVVQQPANTKRLSGDSVASSISISDELRLLIEAGQKTELQAALQRANSKDLSLSFLLFDALKNAAMREDMVKILMQFGANPNIINSDGETPLTAAIKVPIDARKLLAALLDKSYPHPADLNMRNKKGNTGLHEAFLVGRFEYFSMLCTSTNLKIQNVEGFTPHELVPACAPNDLALKQRIKVARQLLHAVVAMKLKAEKPVEIPIQVPENVIDEFGQAVQDESSNIEDDDTVSPVSLDQVIAGSTGSLPVLEDPALFGISVSFFEVDSSGKVHKILPEDALISSDIIGYGRQIPKFSVTITVNGNVPMSVVLESVKDNLSQFSVDSGFEAPDKKLLACEGISTTENSQTYILKIKGLVPWDGIWDLSGWHDALKDKLFNPHDPSKRFSVTAVSSDLDLSLLEFRATRHRYQVRVDDFVGFVSVRPHVSVLARAELRIQGELYIPGTSSPLIPLCQNLMEPHLLERYNENWISTFGLHCDCAEGKSQGRTNDWNERSFRS